MQLPGERTGATWEVWRVLCRILLIYMQLVWRLFDCRMWNVAVMVGACESVENKECTIEARHVTFTANAPTHDVWNVIYLPKVVIMVTLPAFEAVCQIQSILLLLVSPCILRYFKERTAFCFRCQLFFNIHCSVPFYDVGLKVCLQSNTRYNWKWISNSSLKYNFQAQSRYGEHRAASYVLRYTDILISTVFICHGGPRKRSQYSDSLLAGWPRDRIRVGVRFSASVHPGPGDHPPHLAPRLKKN